MKIVVFGKKILSVLVAMLIGLFISLQWLEAHTHSSKEERILQSMEEQNSAWEDMRAFLPIDLSADTNLVPLTSPIIQKYLQTIERHGKPIAAIACDGLFYIDRDGVILGTVDPQGFLDVPIISGDGFQFDVNSDRIFSADLQHALHFLHYLRQSNRVLYAQISEITVHDNLGLVAYLNRGRLIPLVLGHGEVGRKIVYLNAWMREAAVDYLHQAVYLDLRLDGQVVMKKGTSRS